jgi:REP element-mobilizing transposase RayT
VFNGSLMNDAIFKFKRYEDSSLIYTGIDKHAGEDIGGWDIVIRRGEYEALFYNQQATMAAPQGHSEADVSQGEATQGGTAYAEADDEEDESTDEIFLSPPPKRRARTIRETRGADTQVRPDFVTAAYGIPSPIATAPARKEAKPQVDTSWVAVGVSVQHNTFGVGKVIKLENDYITVGFDQGEKRFEFPGAFEKGFLHLVRRKILHLVRRKILHLVRRKILRLYRREWDLMDDKDKFLGRYRIPSARLAGWDYGSNAGYFVTICTRERVCYFGEVVNGEMNYSQVGKLSVACCEQIPVHFPFVDLDSYVIMPNHVHLILMFNKAGVEKQLSNDSSDLVSLHGNRFGPQSQNLASVVRGYKVGVTKAAHHAGLPFAWQPRFHDHIIRNSVGLDVLRNYVAHNPAQWGKDHFFQPF